MTGKQLGHATITRDMTKEWQLQKNLESEKAKMLQASKLSTLGEMAAGVAHEINNPLSVIEGSILSLRRTIQDQSQIRKLDMIEKSVDRITRIVKGLRKFSHSSSGINKIIFSSKSLIDECIELLASKALSNQVNLISENNNEYEIYADEVQIEQIVINLINNAIDANSKFEGAWVKINAESLQDHIKIIVQDSGQGIDPATVDKLFDPFFTTKPPGKGTGLGLSIAKSIAKDHGGDLYYEKRDNHTAFILKIPARRV
jgi:C4-dicarboxylate-specific signal transduction histidine kinase